MNIIVCIDDNNGMMFNHRRQSQDRVLREHILHMVVPNRLWMNSYSGKQFAEIDNSKIIIDEDFLDKASSADYCFIENVDITSYIHKIEKIILFKWNRSYPTDTLFPVDLNRWVLDNTEDFAGYSHKKITRMVYVR